MVKYMLHVVVMFFTNTNTNFTFSFTCYITSLDCYTVVYGMKIDGGVVLIDGATISQIVAPTQCPYANTVLFDSTTTSIYVACQGNQHLIPKQPKLIYF